MAEDREIGSPNKMLQFRDYSEWVQEKYPWPMEVPLTKEQWNRRRSNERRLWERAAGRKFTEADRLSMWRDYKQYGDNYREVRRDIARRIASEREVRDAAIRDEQRRLSADREHEEALRRSNVQYLNWRRVGSVTWRTYPRNTK